MVVTVIMVVMVVIVATVMVAEIEIMPEFQIFPKICHQIEHILTQSLSRTLFSLLSK